MRVPHKRVGLIIGRRGENVRFLQDLTRAHIQVQPERELKPGQTHRSVTLRGAESAVAEAARAVEDMCAGKTRVGSAQVIPPQPFAVEAGTSPGMSSGTSPGRIQGRTRGRTRGRKRFRSAFGASFRRRDVRRSPSRIVAVRLVRLTVGPGPGPRRFRGDAVFARALASVRRGSAVACGRYVFD